MDKKTDNRRRMDNKDMPHNMSKRDMIRAADFNFIKVLGEGSFGKVLQAERRGTDELYAVKVLRKDVIIQTDDLELPMTEKQVLALSGKPPFLVSLHSCFQTMDRLFFVMEYCKGGDLMYHMQVYGRFKESVAVNINVSALQFLAKKPNNRLGAGRYARSEITTNPFFRNIDWDKVEAKEMEPPIVPKIKHRKDISNFDKAFIGEKTDLTPTDKLFMMNLDQSDFIGFSYMNPEFITII
ncbi:protein kinase C, eye isozyme-like [Anastrepha ludens]|uniref:protein kinase C, eye isozyme-like n=1 Tax=Anastrepha ludens TaxID=28586 RepID=UPI0023AF6026|nr:protein kinase C, eye isozyme-like [Anastrepha ludens]